MTILANFIILIIFILPIIFSALALKNRIKITKKNNRYFENEFKNNSQEINGFKGISKIEYESLVNQINNIS